MLFPSDLLDYLNLRIIDILGRDASRPFVEIAKELEISDATVHVRVRRLVAAGTFASSLSRRTAGSWATIILPSWA